MINRLRDPQPADYTDKKTTPIVDTNDSKFSLEARRWLYPVGHAEMDLDSVRTKFHLLYLHLSMFRFV